MIDFERAMLDQLDLDALLAPIEVTSFEKYGRNDGYGFASILKAYAGYDPTAPVEAVIPHGVYFDAERVADEELEAPVPAVLNYPAFRSATWEAASDKVVIPSASPFLYALALFRDAFPEAPPRQGTLFFPAHSTETVGEVVDTNALIRALGRLDDELLPVTVCVHAADYAKGHHRPFVEAGLKVVSAGNVWDPEFMYRWLHLLSAHAHAASNDVGGCAFYSVMADVQFSLIGDPPRQHVDSATHFLTGNMGLFYRPTSTQMRETAEQIRGVFAGPRDAEFTARDLCEYLLGAENLKAPGELLEVLEYAASLAV